MYSITEVQGIVLDQLTDFPNACAVSDTQILLDPASGATMNLDTLLGILYSAPAPYHDEIIADYVQQLTSRIHSLPATMEHLDRRQVLSGITKLIYPEGALPEYQDPSPLTPGLVTTWALVDGDALAVMPSEELLAHATEDELDAQALARVRAYARGVRKTRELGGVLLNGGRQTSSILLYLDDCADALKIPRSEHGYFVAIPDRWHVVIVPATNNDMLLPMIELVAGTFASSEQPFTYFVYHWIDGTMHPLLTDRGFSLTPELEALHGPIEDWDYSEGYWGDAYSA